MAKRPLVTPQDRRRILIAWTFFILLAAAVNVPFATTLLRGRTSPRSRPVRSVQGPAVPAAWPARTPHAKPWPRAISWDEEAAFGFRHYNVIAPGAAPGQNGFQMEVARYGWPLPVLENVQYWWNWNDPTLAGPTPDPPMHILALGLIANPLILGTAAWSITAGPIILLVILRRARRHLEDQCPGCGYPLGAWRTCPECGGAVNPV